MISVAKHKSNKAVNVLTGVHKIYEKKKIRFSFTAYNFLSPVTMESTSQGNYGKLMEIQDIMGSCGEGNYGNASFYMMD